ncbi:MAG: tetratricopeptide repeat protein, partial [Candidatus Stygibacter australis]|nr:tetratricopeptide repeat protein [Candidatus Stygibacter australis]
MERQKFLDAISSSEGKKRIDKILEYSLYLRQVDAEESANQAKIVLEYALSHQENYLETVALAYICTAYFYKSDFDQVIYWSDQLFEKGQKYGDNKSMGDSYNLKARLAFSLDDLTTAQENLLKALEYLIKTDSLMDLLSCYNGLGLIHLAKEELDEAHHFLNLALEIAEQKGSEAQHSIRLNISNILYGQRKFEEALAVNMKTLEFYQDNDRISMKATALNNIALCHRNLGDSEKALEYFKEAYLFYHKTKQYNELCRCCNSLANLYIDSQDWVKAEEYLKEAKQLGETHDLKFSLLAVHNSYSSYHEAKGDFQAANEYLRKRFNLNKELTQESNHEKLAELETKYKTEIYKLKTAELDKKNKGMSNQIVELNESLSDLQTTYLSLQNDFEKVV